jgi:hypothetical protein
MLDTRNYDRSITTLNWNDDYIEDLKDDAGRSLMGSAQENWFYRSLSESQKRGATWRIIGNQIIFSRMNNSAVYSNPLNADQWDVSIMYPSSEAILTRCRATPPTATALFITFIRTISVTPLSSQVTRMPTGFQTLCGLTRLPTTKSLALARLVLNLLVPLFPQAAMAQAAVSPIRAIDQLLLFVTTGSSNGLKVITADTMSYTSHLKSSMHATTVIRTSSPSYASANSS